MSIVGGACLEAPKAHCIRGGKSENHSLETRYDVDHVTSQQVAHDKESSDSELLSTSKVVCGSVIRTSELPLVTRVTQLTALSADDLDVTPTLQIS